MTKIKISVLASVYKSEKAPYLERALQSIYTDQTMKPDEIILIQDGTLGDELLSVISAWKKKLGDILVLSVNDQNIGLTKSLIKGIGLARGKYIARMDTDDISLPERFEKQYNYLEQHLDIDVLGGAIQEFNSQNENLGVRVFPLDNDSAKKYIYKGSPVAHPAAMIRRKLFEDGINYNENYRTTQDLALWFDVLAAGYKINNLPDVVLRFRREQDVYRRRANKKDSKMELAIHLAGIKKLFGFSPIKSLYPIARYTMRLLPYSLIKMMYDSSIRKILMK